MKIRFKEAGIDDLDQCIKMMKDFYAIDKYPFNEEEVSTNFKEFIQTDHLGRFWLLHVHHSVIGYLILSFGYSFEYGGRDAIIDEFFLKEEFRGQGFGEQALSLLKDKAAELKVKAVHLEVEKSNAAGNRLYEKAGFKGNHRSLLTNIILK